MELHYENVTQGDLLSRYIASKMQIEPITFRLRCSQTNRETDGSNCIALTYLQEG